MTAHLNGIGEKPASIHTSRGHECGKVDPAKAKRPTAWTLLSASMNPPATSKKQRILT